MSDLNAPSSPVAPRAAADATRPLKPRDAATMIVVDRSTGDPRVLLGKRRADVAFMPSKYVFPGGRVDPGDRRMAVEDDLVARDIKRLQVSMKGAPPSAARARALAFAAIRETFEETGLVIGRATASLPAGAAAPGWSEFLSLGFVPALSRLTFFARAITPPGRPRRFDARFFFVEATAIAHRIELAEDGELSSLDWRTIEEAKELDLPRITRAVLEDLRDRLTRSTSAAADDPVPFYYQRNGSFRRDLIT
jgi:8-oxo-dGTP pyrophosphatase MutT (NUDIX family)